MENTSYVALSYQTALERKMDIVSNNIANINTDGFKSSHMMFKEHLVDQGSGQKSLSMVEDHGNYRDFAPGTIQETGDPLDIALVGNGFIAVTTADGEKYTRNGNLHLDAKGQLTTSTGDSIADTGGKPITVPAGSGKISISEDGTVTTESGPIGRIKVVRFEKPQDISPVGNSLYETKQDAAPDTETTVKQGAIEGSNVNAVMEMTTMMEVMRKYESVARLLQNEHDSQIGMIQKMSRIN